jgi:hypothetical protein
MTVCILKRVSQMGLFDKLFGTKAKTTTKTQPDNTRLFKFTSKKMVKATATKM